MINIRRPEGGPEFERRLLAWWTTDAAQSDPRTAASRCGFAATVPGRGGQRPASHPATLDPGPEGLHWESVSQQTRTGYVEILGLLTRKVTPAELIGFAAKADLKDAQEQLPVILLRPTSLQRSHVHCGQPGRETGVVGCQTVNRQILCVGS